MLLLISFIITIVYKYQQKQNAYYKDIETLKSSHQNALLQSQLEIQEQTFQHISREIHDNIGQKLSLAKLHLNTVNYEDSHKTILLVNDSLHMIGEAINDLSDLSHSLSSEIILNNGLIKALEFEMEQLKKSDIYSISFSITGSPVFLDADAELVIFRIVQEAINNIIKHAAATKIAINLHYNTHVLLLEINDNGRGFYTGKIHNGTGLQNLKKRATALKGNLSVNSTINIGTSIKIEIPLYANKETSV